MGCDIHLYVEKRVNGVWQSADTWSRNKYDDESDRLTVEYDDRFYKGRNYDLFALLANVRNRNGIQPIAEPRGLPDDVTSDIRAESELWGVDRHSHSYLGLDELLAHNWSGEGVELSGVVSEEEYRTWKSEGYLRPKMYSQGVYGPDILVWDEEEYLKQFPKLPAGRHYIRAKWNETHGDFSSNFMAVLDKLKSLSENPADVRIVFWFDN